MLADLHLDRWLPHGLDPLDHLSNEDLAQVDICILAGDLTDKATIRWPGAFDWLCRRLDLGRVHVFEGNHDYYAGRIDDGERHAAIAAAHGVGYVQRSEIVRDGHRFLCCTLWSDFALNGERFGAMYDAGRVMNDYRRVRVGAEGYRKLYPEYTARLHSEHRAWLAQRLADPFGGETTVVTHHAPHPSCVSPGDPLGPAYASDLTHLIEEHRPACWIYGHTHRAHRITVGDTEIVCASVGRPQDRDDPDGPARPAIIDLPTTGRHDTEDDCHG
ncbi:metallophosphoesterase [Jannaschia formosa]|uniref:metallophosphoesterase n=1 Tax=Jannaschia formosa TaxID=2259592 RepID=UPI00142FC6D6|nr:metallophosphoesterase [Jannaschia formosa]